MASIVVAGDTSGTVTLAAPAVSGTTTLTLPTTSGTLVTTASGQTLNSPTIATPTITGQATIPTINLTGGQITFPATAVPSADANCLDDYEEGTWTPTLLIGGNSGATQATRYGLYTKIGNIVTVTLRLAISNKNGLTGGIGVSGLPFTADFSGWACMGINAFNWLGGTKYPVIQIVGGSATATIKALGTDLDFNNGEISDSFEIRAAFSYKAA